MPRSVRIFLLVVLAGTFYFSIQARKWEKNRVLIYDVSLYYTYLPALVIYNDLKMEKAWDYDLFPHHVAHAPQQRLKRPLKVTYGVSVFYAPFFFIAHALAEPLGFEPTGYSEIYAIALIVSSIFWLIVGLWFLAKFLLRRASPMATIVTLTVLYVGTNLLYYVVYRSPMSHVYSFAIISMLLFIFDPKYTRKEWLFWGGLAAVLAMVVRPVNLLLILPIAIFWLWHRDRDLSLRKEVLPVLIGGIIPPIPQLLYWKSLTGKWLYNPYVNEGFFWNDPKIIEGFFSWRSGWLIYTPIMLFGIWALWRDALNGDLRSKLTTLILLLYWYVTFAWWCWWYGGSYSIRPLIDSYPLFALPLALMFDGWNLKNWSKLMYIPLALLISYNVLTTYQYDRIIIHWDGMTRDSYRMIFLRTQNPPEKRATLERPDYEAAKLGEPGAR
ncbi:MAG: hypothetical protein J4F31_06075 [Flavobacteriales bacterium]|nr:hypothetical protein [Flavobacteriales bacterium]